MNVNRRRARTSSSLQAFRSIAEIASITAVVRVIGMGREVVLARSLGVTDELDAFLLAFAVFTFFNTALVQPYLSSRVPSWTQDRDRYGAAAADHLAFRSLRRWLLVAIGVAGTTTLLSGQIVHLLAANFTASKADAAAQALRILCAGLVVRAPSTAFIALLHARRRFVLPSMVPAALPIAVIVALTAGQARTAPSLAWAVSVGLVAELALLALAIRPLYRGASDTEREKADDGDLRFWSQYRALALGAFIMAGSVIVDQSMAARLGSGSLSILSYGERLPSVLIGVVVLAIGTTVLPLFSDLAAAKDYAELRRVTGGHLRTILLVMSVPTIILVACARPLVDLIYAGGELHAGDAEIIAQVLQMSALQIPFFVASTLGSRVLSALQRNQVLIAVATVNLTTNIIGNLILSSFLGVRGIALSTALVYAGSTALLTVATRRALATLESAHQPAGRTA